MGTSQEWLEARRQGIGGSDWQHVLNVPPWGCLRRLFYDKTNVPEDVPQRESGAMTRGHKLEQLVAEEFEKRTGRRTRHINKVHRAAGLPDWWIGNPDRGIVYDNAPGFGEPSPGILEIKTVHPTVWATLQRDGLPVRWLYQLQHYLSLTGRDWGAIAVLEPVNWKFEAWSFEFNGGLERTMREIGDRFWGAVAAEEVPQRPVNDPDRRCSSCPWRFTCWKEREFDIGEAAATDDIQTIRNEAAEGLLERRAELLEMRDSIQEEIRQIEDGLKQALGEDPRRVRIGRFLVTMSVYTRRAVDSKALRELYPEIAEKVTRGTVVRSLRITGK